MCIFMVVLLLLLNSMLQNTCTVYTAMQCNAYKQRANKKDKRTFVTSENKTGNSAKNSKLFIDCASIANNYGENVAILSDIFALSLTFNSHLLQ